MNGGVSLFSVGSSLVRRLDHLRLCDGEVEDVDGLEGVGVVLHRGVM